MDSALAIKACLENYYREDYDAASEGSECSASQVTMYVNPVAALLEFKLYYYDLLIVDINMSLWMAMNYANIKICVMSSGEINYEAIREIRHESFGCFIKKPATNDYLVKRVLQELC